MKVVLIFSALVLLSLVPARPAHAIFGRSRVVQRTVVRQQVVAKPVVVRQRVVQQVVTPAYVAPAAIVAPVYAAPAVVMPQCSPQAVTGGCSAFFVK
jgi:hypothetical protein